jgi:hypothetical protein
MSLFNESKTKNNLQNMCVTNTPEMASDELKQIKNWIDILDHREKYGDRILRLVEQLEIFQCEIDRLNKKLDLINSVSEDVKRLDWIQQWVEQHGGIVLHDGLYKIGQYEGLGFNTGWRTLRKAIDDVRKYTSSDKKGEPHG